MAKVGDTENELQLKIDRLKLDITDRRTAIAAFQSDLEDLLNPPKYPNVRPSELFQRLQAVIETENNELVRQRRIQQAKEVLAEAKQELQQLEDELAALRVEQQAAIDKPLLWQSAEELRSALLAAEEAYKKFEEAYAQYGRSVAAFQKQNPIKNELEQSFWTMLFPVVDIREKAILVLPRQRAKQLQLQRQSPSYSRQEEMIES